MNFEFMDKAVDDLCKSMEDNPNRWVIDIYTLNDTKTGIEYWIGSDACITEISAGRSNHRVFSDAQGKRLWKSFEALRETKANSAQRRVLRGLGEDDAGLRPAHIALLVVVSFRV